MRKIVLISLLFFALRGHGQIYHPLLDNTSWYESVTGFLGTSYYWYYTDGDSISSSKTYKKIKSTSSSSFVRLLREDISQKKVFALDYQGNEIVLYDFSLSVNSQFAIHGYASPVQSTLIQIDSVLTGVGYRKRLQFQLNPPSPSLIITIIESVGSVEDPILITNYGGDPVYSLICNHQNAQLVYYKGSNVCYIYPLTGVTEAGFSNAISLSPNPAVSVMQLSNSDWQGTKMNVEIFNIFGRSIHRSEIDKAQEEINVSDYPKGIYYLKVSSGGGFVIKKFVKI